MDIRIPEELRATIPQLGEVSEQADPMVWVKLTCGEAGWTWYVIEVQELAANAIFYVYTVGWDEDLHYLIRSDLERKSAEWGFPIVRDETFVPCLLSQVQARERGNRKFPLGQLVATPGQPRRSCGTSKRRPSLCGGIGAVIGANLTRKMSRRMRSH